MKKYNIFNLYIVSVKNTDYKLLCKHHKYDDYYIEIFTNKKIKKINILNIEPLANQYSVLEVCNYTTKEPLMLSEETLLINYIRINTKQKEKELKKIKNTPNSN